MPISQKCEYALRAIFELSKNNGAGPLKIAEIARRQAIPTRFLEIILNELKRGGFVKALRGKEGGFLLARSPDSLKIGEVMRFIEGSFAPVGCMEHTDACPLYGGCVFLLLWEKAENALEQVYDGTTFFDLIKLESLVAKKYKSCIDYTI